jgi:succinate dehydrogenase/fumarate reductase-like Fe-S protein
VLSGRALALVLLAWSLIRVLARYLGKQLPGMVQFRAHYGAERLLSIDRDQRAALVRFSRCIACGRCDVGEADRIMASAGAYPGLMQLVRASSRSIPDFDAAARGFAHVPRDVLVAKAAVCPTGVPFLQLATFVRGNAQAWSADGR